MEKRICPECGNVFIGHPALSRKDNKTLICQECGVRQAMASMGVDPVEAEKVVDLVRKYSDPEEK